MFARAGKGSGAGTCSVCGAHYKYGDLWRHTGLNEYIHVGHDCADKYSMIADRSAFELEMDRRSEAKAAIILAKQTEEQKQAFFSLHPGLEAALATNHPIVRDIAGRFTQYKTLSEKQVALVFKLAHEVANPKPQEAHVPAPEGRVCVKGLVLSVKQHESQFGPSLKMTVKVLTDAGSWLCWGTVPGSLLNWANKNQTQLRGCEVAFCAELTRGRDAHFALFKRPTQAEVVVQPVTP